MSLIISGTWKLGPQLTVPFWGAKGYGLAEEWMSLEAGFESLETCTIFSSLFLLIIQDMNSQLATSDTTMAASLPGWTLLPLEP